MKKRGFIYLNGHGERVAAHIRTVNDAADAEREARLFVAEHDTTDFRVRLKTDGSGIFLVRTRIWNNERVQNDTFFIPAEKMAAWIENIESDPMAVRKFVKKSTHRL